MRVAPGTHPLEGGLLGGQILKRQMGVINPVVLTQL